MRNLPLSRALLSALMIMIAAGGVFAAGDTASHDIVLDVSEIAAIGLNDGSAITLTTAGTIAPGADPASAAADSDASKRLQYTSVVQSGTTRNITVALGATAVPTGTELTIEATSMPAVTGVGSAAGLVVLSSTAANLVTGIGSTATGTGSSGVELTYSFRITDVTQLTNDSDATVTVTYTLTDAS